MPGPVIYEFKLQFTHNILGKSKEHNTVQIISNMALHQYTGIVGRTRTMRAAKVETLEVLGGCSRVLTLVPKTPLHAQEYSTFAYSGSFF